MPGLHRVGQGAGVAAVAATPGGSHSRATDGKHRVVAATGQAVDRTIEGDGQRDGLARAVARGARHCYAQRSARRRAGAQRRCRGVDHRQWRGVDVGDVAAVGGVDKAVARRVADASDQRGLECSLINGGLAVLARLHGVGESAGVAAIDPTPSGRHSHAAQAEDGAVVAAGKSVDQAVKGDGECDGFTLAVASAARHSALHNGHGA